MAKSSGALAVNFIAYNGFGLCVRCLCALARVSASNDAKPVLYAAFFCLKNIFLKMFANSK